VVRYAIDVKGWEVIGIEDGYEGLITRRWRPLQVNDVRGLLVRGGTILGSSNRGNPFRYPVTLPDGTQEIRDLSAQMVANVQELGLDALLTVGGDGSLTMASRLHDLGVPVIGVPKTIDNDLQGTDYTFGYHTAVQIATECIDRLHTTAESHDRVMLCEVMGRYAGWIALEAGVAGGADIILIPELPYDIQRITAAIRARKARGVSFSIIVVAEGARPAGGEMSVSRPADVLRQQILGGAADRLAHALRDRIDLEVRTTVLGHIQRGGTPTAFDRILGTRLGVAAVDLVAQKGFGRMVCLRTPNIESVPLAEAVGQLKRVDPVGPVVAAARATGVELGG
jgi:6-phosphofructokinase 1